MGLNWINSGDTQQWFTKRGLKKIIRRPIWKIGISVSKTLPGSRKLSLRPKDVKKLQCHQCLTGCNKNHRNDAGYTMRYPMKKQAGFSLTELLIVMAVSMILLAGIASAFSSHAKTTSMQVLTVDTVHRARTALASMTKDIRMAGYRTSSSAVTGISQATANSIRVLVDLNQDGSTSGSDEDITYAFDDSSKTINRNGSVLANHIESLTLTYTLKDGSTTQAPTDLSGIRKVRLTLIVRSSTIDPLTADYKRFELTSDITPRNMNL
jgi:prepilin-type N-terminal cleavage/methylation domain-containing protein